MGTGVVFAAVVVGASFAVAVAALLVVRLFDRRRPVPAPVWAEGMNDPAAVFIFDDRSLVDATESARALIAASPVEVGSDWARLTACLAPRFPDLARRMADLAAEGRLTIPAADPADPARLEAEWRDGLARLVLRDKPEEGGNVLVDRLSLQAAEDELALMRALMEHAPLPIWQTSRGGDVIWANRAYLELLMQRDGDALDLVWPLPRLFSLPAAGQNGDQRRAISCQDGKAQRWFTVSAHPQGENLLCWALPADEVVRAETRLAEFTQTLTKTFAHLPIGLAVFDRRRRLQLFNPALGDLTELGPEFLTSRPSLEVFLDRLRERQMLPEPRDYKTWRRELTELESAAASGRYQETWTLPLGQTFRVTGRPHPDGAVAFLFEDITAEVSLSRRFRAEIEIGQAVVDSLDEALVVFSHAGQMVMSNQAYADLWGVDPMSSMGETGLPEALRHWQRTAGQGPHWARLRASVGLGDRRARWTEDVVLPDHRVLRLRVEPLSGGATLVGFVALTVGLDRPAATAPARRADTLPGAGFATADLAPAAASIWGRSAGH